MRSILRTILFFTFIWTSSIGFAQQESHSENHSDQAEHVDEGHQEESHEDDGHGEVGHGDDHGGGHHGEKPAAWSVIPFVLLLLMIATGPLFYEHFWHKNYPIIAVMLAALVVLYYLFKLHNQHGPVHALAEYVQFIALLTGLYVASGGIMIIVDKYASAKTNVIILAIGAVIANIIGTTGASMLWPAPG